MKPPRQRELRLACLFLSALALAACQGEERTAETAPQGEVLPGSVSDAMLPLDTVRSQPPFAPQTEAADGSGRRSASGDATEASSADAGEDDAEDATEPTAAAPVAAASAAADTAP
jgi:hypothetical protein